MDDALNDIINKAMENGYVYVEDLTNYFAKDSAEYDKIVKKLQEEDVDIITHDDDPHVPEDVHEIESEIEKIPRTTDSLTAYINDIKTFPLLTADEEFALATDIKNGKLAKEKLETEKENLSPEEIQELEDTVDRGEASKEYFINCNLRLVVWWSSKYRNKGLSQDDLF